MRIENNINDSHFNNDEIDLIAIGKAIWKGRRIIIWCIILFITIGFLIAFTSPKVFTVSTTMVPQVQSKSGNLGGLGGLAAMAGINLGEMGSGSAELSPSVYPEIVRSYPFQKEIMNFPLTWNLIKRPMSLAEYLHTYGKPKLSSIIKKYTIGLPGLVLSLFSKQKLKTGVIDMENDSLFHITDGERDIYDVLSSNLYLRVDNKIGYLTLTAMGPEPLMTAQLADKAQKLLREKITEYRIDKAQQNLTFIQDRYNEKKKEFEIAQNQLAHFRDRNLNVSSNIAKTEEERLSSEYQLAFNVFTELAKQLESSKIKIKEDTPVFSIIQPVSIPLDKTKPNISLIVIIWFIMGCFAGVLMVMTRQNLKVMREKWVRHGS